MRAARGLCFCWLVFTSGCEQRAPIKLEPSDQSIPWATDESGRHRAWSGCPARVLVQVENQPPLSPAVRAEIKAAFTSWKLPGVPTFVPQFGAQILPNEDGVSSLSFVTPSRCGSGSPARGTACLDESWEGLTAIYGRPTEQHAETIEVDVRVDRKLLGRPHRLREVIVHELGHVLGLDHPHLRFEAKDSVMGSSVPTGSHAPGKLDLERVTAVYGKLCDGQKR